MNKDTKHTPGPWQTFGMEVGKSKRHLICTLYQRSGNSASLGVEVTKANAKLIAAAPDLLAALRAMNNMGGDDRGGYCICTMNDGSAPDSDHSTCCLDARKAIAKATFTS